MTQEAKFRLRIDAEEAKRKLKELANEAAASGGRVADRVRGALGRGLSMVNPASGATGAAAAAIRGPTAGGIGDVLGEALGPLGAQVEKFFLGDMGAEAKAAKFAREDAIGNFAQMAGRSGQVPAGAKAYFDQVKGLQLEQEKGRKLFEQNKDFYGASPEDLMKRITDAVATLLRDACDYLISKINPFE